MSLQKYWLKRDFEVTPEPKGTVAKSTAGLHYYIQRHHARRLHYDFRLEMGGTLKSWAIPKGPSLNPTDKRLAVHVEDHPLAYGTFEGNIPAGQYGAGKVILWDQGIWVPLNNPEQGYRNGSLKFELIGHKLAGKWALVRMGKPTEKENWLLIKEKDDVARTGTSAQITELRPESVAGLDLNKSHEFKSDQTTHVSTAEMPKHLYPQLATLVQAAPQGDEWLSEIKYDGYRALACVHNAKVTIYTRNGNDWTTHWPQLADKLAQLPIDNAWLDGEVVAIKNGKISFSALQYYEEDHAKVDLRYYLFDLVYLNGQDLSPLPLIDRKSLLKEILASQKAGSPLLYSDHIVGNPDETFESACRNGLEGIVLKRINSPYVQTRGKNWLKLKCIQRQEFVIGGFTDPQGDREGFGALLLGWYDNQGDLVYAGRVGTGFNQPLIQRLAKQFKPLVIQASPFKVSPKGKDAIGVHWLKPSLIAEVKFGEWTTDGRIRHSAFVGLRSDKPAASITREVPIKVDAMQTSQPTNDHHLTDQQTAQTDLVAGIKISHPDRLIFTPEALTKLDIAQYYHAMGAWILPHLKGRPLSLLRCPNGAENECFFQKHLNEFDLKHIQTIKIDGHDKGEYLVANTLPALIGLIQFGVVELHTWGSTTKHLQQPDRIILDLDPDPELPWVKVIEGTRLVKYLLDEIGLISFLKTTGGKGLHVVVPIKAEFEFPVIKAFAKSIAEHLATTVPSHFVAVMTKSRRTGKIYIDYLRNGEEATAIAAYSVRARPGAPISTPIDWNELNENLSSNTFNVLNIHTRMMNLERDPWQNYASTKQRITQDMINAFSKTA